MLLSFVLFRHFFLGKNCLFFSQKFKVLLGKFLQYVQKVIRAGTKGQGQGHVQGQGTEETLRPGHGALRLLREGLLTPECSPTLDSDIRSFLCILCT